MRSLLSSTCVIAVAIAAPAAAAEIVISTAITTPVLTSTGADDLRISSTGSVKPTAGTAVTLDSNDNVKNEGTIQITGANNAIGIGALPGLTGNITNSGIIIIDEAFTPTDTDNDGDIDGPFAQGTNRYGIRVQPGGTFTGTISNSGAVTVEGNQSAGIAVDSALVGSILHSGTISVLGTDAVGIRATDVSGNVILSKGGVSARGEDAIGVALNGDIGGALVIQGSVTSSGYRSTSAPADPSKLDADDLLQGGPAVLIAGNVAGGILFDAPPADTSSTDTDEDDDGVTDSNETTASISSYGAAPAVLVGSASEDIVIGAVASSSAGHGFVTKGTITGQGVYTGIDATALQIGGTGHAVTIAGGATLGGSVSAKALNADATAVHIGAGATVPTLNVTGAVSAQGGGTAATGAQAIVIDSGASVTSITNSGSILAARSGTEGTASGIVDHSGTLTLIENKGSIGVIGAATLGDKGVAFDLSANSSGATVRQLAVASTALAPAISGTMLFGSGNDVLDVADGAVVGTAKFGAGNDALSLSGDAVMTGNVQFGTGTAALSLAGTSALNGVVDFGGGGGTLDLTGSSLLRGGLANSAGVAVNVGAGSTLDMTQTGTVALGSLTTGAGSTLGISLNSDTGAVTLYDVAGEASFGADTKINVNLQTVGGVTGTYTIVNAGTLTGVENLSSVIAELPFLYESSIAAGDPGEVLLSLNVKSADQLGLNLSEGGILGAALDAADADSAIAAMFLGAGDEAEVRSTLQQLLPEHSGGAFETATKGSRLTAGVLSDSGLPLVERNGLGMWMQQVAWSTSKSIGSTSSYDVSGWGAIGGVEHSLGGLGSVGVSLAFLSGKDNNRSNELISDQYEGGVYWRSQFGPVQAFARGTAGVVEIGGHRVFEGTVDGTAFRREAEGEWKGRLYSATAGVAYTAQMGRFSIRPLASIEHYKLSEDGYTETGGGDAFNLTVGDRDSNETAANGVVTLGYQLMGSPEPGSGWFRVELEGGRREVLSGSLGATTASFAGGDTFTLAPEKRTSGFRGALRLLGGGPGVAISGEFGGEEQQGELSLGGRLGIQFAL